MIRGRLNRFSYNSLFLSGLAILVIALKFFRYSSTVLILLLIFFLVFNAWISTKRAHDLGHSGFWLLKIWKGSISARLMMEPSQNTSNEYGSVSASRFQF